MEDGRGKENKSFCYCEIKFNQSFCHFSFKLLWLLVRAISFSFECYTFDIKVNKKLEGGGCDRNIAKNPYRAFK